MTDNLDTGANAGVVPPQPRRRWYQRFRPAFLQHENRAAWMRFGRKYDAHVYMIVVAIGLPCMALIVRNHQVKVLIACIWYAWAPLLYFYFEGMEMNAQILQYGLLRQQDSDYQRKTMFYPYFGALFAFVAWLLVDAMFVAADLASTWQSQSFGSIMATIFASPWVTPLRYGFVEWAILIHTIIVAALAISVYYPLMSNFLQATAGQKRFEERV
jgi:hypothetical protein